MDWSGRTLDGRYRIERVLGQGGMGSAYLARDERVGRPVVVKAPHEDLLRRPGFRERFDREIRSLLDLEHPHVVKVLDIGAVDGTPFVVLQYLAGGSLRERLDRAGGTLTPSEVIAWLPGVAQALDFLHARAWLHRDVKPANILFDDAGNVFLSDFGIAKAASATTSGLTETGLTPGSPSYMAPEIALGQPIGPAYDQYALGIVAYEALAGKLPYEATDPLFALVAKIQKDPIALQEAAPHVARSTAAAVMQALARDPKDRFLTCTAFATAFRDGPTRAAAAAQPTMFPGATATAPAAAGPRRSSAGRRVAVLAVVLAVGGIATVVALRGKGDEGAPPADRGAARRGPVVPDPTPSPPPATPAMTDGAVPAPAPPAPRPSGSASTAMGDAPKPLPPPPPETPASIRVESPTEGAWIRGEAVRVVGTVSGRGAVRVNGRDAVRSGDRFQVELPLGVEGALVVDAEVARDGAPQATDRRSVHVDRTAPELSISDPIDGAVLDASPIEVRGRVADASPLRLTVDGLAVRVQPDGTFVASLDVAEDVVRDVRIVARDAADNDAERVLHGVRWRRPASARFDAAVERGDLAQALVEGRRWHETADPAGREAAESRLIAALIAAKGPAADVTRFAEGLVALLPTRPEPRQRLVAQALEAGDLVAARRGVDAWIAASSTSFGPAAEPSARLLAEALARPMPWSSVETAAAAGEALRGLLDRLGAVGAPAAAALATRVTASATGAAPLDEATLAFLAAADSTATAAIRDERLRALARATTGAGPELAAVLAYGRLSRDWAGVTPALDAVARAALERRDAATLAALLADAGARATVEKTVAGGVVAGLGSGVAFSSWTRIVSAVGGAGVALPGVDAAVAAGAVAAAAAATTPEAVDGVLRDARSVAKLPTATEGALRGAALMRTAEDAKSLGERVEAYGTLVGHEVPPDLWSRMFVGRLQREEVGEAVFWLGRLESRGPLAPQVAARAAELKQAQGLLTLLEGVRTRDQALVLSLVDFSRAKRDVIGATSQRMLRVRKVTATRVDVEVFGARDRTSLGTAALELRGGALVIASWSERTTNGGAPPVGLSLSPGVAADPASKQWMLPESSESYEAFTGRAGGVAAALLVPTRRFVELLWTLTGPASNADTDRWRDIALAADGRFFAGWTTLRNQISATIPVSAAGRRTLRGRLSLPQRSAAKRERAGPIQFVISFDGQPATTITLTPATWSAPFAIPVPEGAATVDVKTAKYWEAEAVLTLWRVQVD